MTEVEINETIEYDKERKHKNYCYSINMAGKAYETLDDLRINYIQDKYVYYEVSYVMCLISAIMSDIARNMEVDYGEKLYNIK